MYALIWITGVGRDALCAFLIHRLVGSAVNLCVTIQSLAVPTCHPGHVWVRTSPDGHLAPVQRSCGVTPFDCCCVQQGTLRHSEGHVGCRKHQPSAEHQRQWWCTPRHHLTKDPHLHAQAVGRRRRRRDVRAGCSQASFLDTSGQREPSPSP